MLSINIFMAPHAIKICVPLYREADILTSRLPCRPGYYIEIQLCFVSVTHSRGSPSIADILDGPTAAASRK